MESGSPDASGASQELELAAKLLMDGKKLIDADPDSAVPLLHQALQLRLKLHGVDAVECAETHLYYGAALFELARAASGVLGQDAEKAEAAAGGGGAEAEAADEGGPSAGTAGAGPSTSAAARRRPQLGDDDEEDVDADDESEQGVDEGEEDDEDADSEAAGEGEEGGAQAQAAATEDMQLAWENIERARLLYRRAGVAGHERPLALVHNALADISSEAGKFDEAVEDFKTAIALWEQVLPISYRHLAEMQYKLAFVYQYQGASEPALRATDAATASLEKARAELEQQLNALPEDAEEEGAKVQASIGDIGLVMAELQFNRGPLQQEVNEQLAVKESLRNSLLMAMQATLQGGQQAGVSAGASGPAGVALQAAAAPGGGALALSSMPSSKVQDLGVVGRGTKRITLQPMQPSSAGAGDAPAGTAGGSEVSRKRSLNDIMGGPGGSTTTGFGAPAAPAPGAAAVPAEASVKRAKPEAVVAAPQPENLSG